MSSILYILFKFKTFYIIMMNRQEEGKVSNELEDLVYSTLNSQGMLGQIKA